MRFCLDTNVLIEAWSRAYPQDVFPSLWLKIDNAIGHGLIIAPDEVLEELSKKEDELFTWAKARPQLFFELDYTLQSEVSRILTDFPRLVDTVKGRSGADPFVIGLARIKSLTVVTGEKNQGTMEKPRIPIVCNQYGIKCISLLEMIRELGWNF